MNITDNKVLYGTIAAMVITAVGVAIPKENRQTIMDTSNAITATVSNPTRLLPESVLNQFNSLGATINSGLEYVFGSNKPAEPYFDRRAYMAQFAPTYIIESTCLDGVVADTVKAYLEPWNADGSSQYPHGKILFSPQGVSYTDREGSYHFMTGNVKVKQLE
jgi:hypothetical protein